MVFKGPKRSTKGIRSIFEERNYFKVDEVLSKNSADALLDDKVSIVASKNEQIKQFSFVVMSSLVSKKVQICYHVQTL